MSEPCPDCEGSGRCTTCNGSGYDELPETDHDMFTGMLTRAGAPYKSEVDDGGLASITLQAWDDHGVVQGHPYFIAKFDFDATGAFKCVGIWE